MKNLKVTTAGLLALCFSIGVVTAQTATNTTTPAAKPATTKATATKAKTPAAGTSTPATGTTPAKPAQHLKKDGTPDMRYKENKAAAGKTNTKKATAAPATNSAAPASSATPAK